MKDKKVVFMGTPEFSLNVLESLIENCNVIAVVTQPDKEVGRKHVLTISPVKALALKHNIKVLQPRKLRNEYQDIIDLNPDVIITCAYGQILPYELLSYPKYKTINVHASLLPKLRGGAPIQRAIMEGYKKTGVTIMRTEAGMDDGDMISSYEIEIKDDDTYETLSSKLSVIGKDLLIKTLPSIFDGTCKYIKQNEDEVTFAKIIKKEDEYLNLFIDIQLEVLSKRVPLLNRIKDKYRRKLAELDIDTNTKYELSQRLEGMKNHDKLCHGDFNPSNIIIDNNGQYHIIDWAHATQGNASADIAKTYLMFLMRGKKEIAEKYLDLFAKKSEIDKVNVQRWLPIIAAVKMEKAEDEELEFLKRCIDIVDYE